MISVPQLFEITLSDMCISNPSVTFTPQPTLSPFPLTSLVKFYCLKISFFSFYQGLGSWVYISGILHLLPNYLKFPLPSSNSAGKSPPGYFHKSLYYSGSLPNKICSELPPLGFIFSFGNDTFKKFLM